MLSVSTKAIYGLAAMTELAGAPLNKPVQTRAIAEKQAIPVSYLEQLLNELKRIGLVKSYRGAQGGYTLVRPAREITVKEIMEQLVGPISLTDSDAKRGTGCRFWQDVEEKLTEIFDVSLESVMLSQQQAQKVLSFTI